MSPELDAVVLRALTKDPDQRYQTMKEFWNALEALTDDPMAWPEVTSGRFASVGDISAAVRLPTPIPTAEVLRVVPTRWGLFGGLMLAAVGLAVGTALYITHKSTPPPTVAPIAEAHEVQVEVRSVTPGTQATIRGKQYPLPLKTRLARNTQAEMIELAAPGHVTNRTWLTLDRDVLLDTTLAEEKAPTPTPTPTPEPVVVSTAPHPSRSSHPPVVAKTTHVVTPPSTTPAPTTPTPQPTPAPSPPPVAAKPPEPVVKPATPAPTPARPATPQPLAPSIVQRQTQAHRAQIESCIAEDPAATGRLVFRLVVGTSGRVESTQLIEAAHRFPPVERCLSKNLSTWVFSPAPSALSEGRASIDLD